MTGQSDAKLKCSVFTQYRNGKPFEAARAQSDLRIYSWFSDGSKSFFFSLGRKLSGLKYFECMRTCPCEKSACEDDATQIEIVTARFSDHIWGNSASSDSLATLSASFDNSSCAPWKKKKVVPMKLICARAVKNL